MIIIVIIALVTLVGGLALLTSTGYKGYHFSKDRAQALYLAEAGISSAIREIKGDGYLPVDYYGEGIGSVPQTSLEGGSYSVNGEATMPSRGGVEATSEHGSLGELDDPQYYEYKLTSTGEISGVSRQAQVTYRVSIDIEEFKHIASYTNSCDPELVMAGAYQTPVLPSPIMEFFRDNADHIYESNFTSGTEDKLLGVYYVQGDAHLRQGTTLEGTIIVDGREAGGTLAIEKTCEIDPSKNPDSSEQDFPAIVVYGGTGNVIIKKETQINGLSYTSNSLNTQKDCKIKGVIIADNITLGQDNTIEYQEVFPPGFWGGTSASGGTTRKLSLEPGTWQSS